MIRGTFDGRAYSAIYASKCSNQNYWHDESFSTWSYSGDTLFFNSATSAEDQLQNPTFLSEPFAVADIVGTNAISGERPYDARKFDHKPIQPQYNWDIDSRRYSSLAAVINSALGRVSHREADLVERQIIHGHYDGTVHPSGWDFIHQPPGDRNIGWLSSVPNKAPNVDRFTWVSVEDIHRNGSLAYTMHYFARDNDIEHIFDAYDLAMLDLSSPYMPTRHLPGSDAYVEYHGVSDNGCFKEPNHYHVDISYEYRVVRGAPSNYGSYLVHIDFDLWFHATSEHNRASEMLYPSLTMVSVTDRSTTVAYQDTDPSWIVDGGWRLVDRFTTPQLNIGFARSIYQVDERLDTTFELYSQIDSGPNSDRLAGFETWVERFMTSIRPSHFYAASDALDSQVQLLKANNLQNAQHLAGVMEQIPDLASIASTAAEAMRGDPAAILHFVDVAASEILKARFERDPTIKDTKEIIESDILNRLGTLLTSSYHTAYGKFTYDFTSKENTYGPGKLSLQARAKVRFYLDAGTLMAGLYTANAVGVLPTLSRIWSVVPFSFVVDWLTNMSSRLHAVDNQLAYGTLGVNWSLYSFKLLYEPTDEELLEHGLISPAPNDRLKLVVYRREFTHWMPHLMESKFDFLRRSNKPNVVTVGALIWSLL